MWTLVGIWCLVVWILCLFDAPEHPNESVELQAFRDRQANAAREHKGT